MCINFTKISSLYFINIFGGKRNLSFLCEEIKKKKKKKVYRSNSFGFV